MGSRNLSLDFVNISVQYIWFSSNFWLILSLLKLQSFSEAKATMQKVGLPSTLSPGISAMLLFKRGNYERHAEQSWVAITTCDLDLLITYVDVGLDLPRLNFFMILF